MPLSLVNFKMNLIVKLILGLIWSQFNNNLFDQEIDFNFSQQVLKVQAVYFGIANFCYLNVVILVS